MPRDEQHAAMSPIEVLESYIGHLTRNDKKARYDKIWEDEENRWVPYMKASILGDAIEDITNELKDATKYSVTKTKRAMALDVFKLTYPLSRVPEYRAALRGQAMRLPESVELFLSIFRDLVSISQNVLRAWDSQPSISAPKVSAAQFDRNMERDHERLVRRIGRKRAEMGKIEKEIYDASPFNKKSGLNSLVLSMLDPRGPWGYSSGDLAGDYETNWDAFKSSLENLKKADGTRDKALGLGMVALSSLALIPFLPSPGKGAGKVATGAGKTSKQQIIRNSADASSKMRTLADAGELSASQARSVKNLADEIDYKVKLLKIPNTKRINTYINGITKQINRSILSGLKSGKIKVGSENKFKIDPSDAGIPKADLFLFSVNIKTSAPAVWANTNAKLSRGGSYYSPSIAHARGFEGTGTWEVAIDITVNPKYVRTNGTVSPEILNDISGVIKEVSWHEMVHARQAKRARRQTGGPLGKEETGIIGPQKDPQAYPMGYREMPHEIESFSLSSVKKIKDFRKNGVDTVDELLSNLRIPGAPQNMNDFAFFANTRETKLFAAALKKIRGQQPCAVISAKNLFDMFGSSVPELEELASDIYLQNTDALHGIRKAKPGKDRIAAIKKLKTTAVKIHPRGCRKAMRENYLRRVILEEIQAVLSSQ